MVFEASWTDTRLPVNANVIAWGNAHGLAPEIIKNEKDPDRSCRHLNGLVLLAYLCGKQRGPHRHRADHTQRLHARPVRRWRGGPWKISAKDLSATDQTLLPASTLQMVVNCDAQTLFALKGIENSVGSTNPNGFGLGLINGNQPLGHYTLELLNASADTAAATTLKSVDDGKTWDAMGGDVWSTLNLASFGNQSGGNWAPIPIKDLAADLKVSTLIAPASELDLTNEVPIDGSATLEVKYL